MAVNSYRVTMFVNYREAGYSFSLWQSVEALEHATVLTRANTLRAAYGRCLGVGATMPYVRVANVDSPSDSLPDDVPQMTVGQGGAGAPEGFLAVTSPYKTAPPDFVQTAKLFTLIASPTAKNHFFMRLMPDLVTQNTLTPDPITAWNNVVTLLKEHLLDANFGWKVRAKDRAAVNTPQKIDTIRLTTVDGIQTVGLVMKEVPPASWVDGATIKITGMKTAPYLNGSYKQSGAVAGKIVSLISKQKPYPDIRVIGEGSAGTSGYLYSPIIRVNGPVDRERKGGRPFGSPRGRRK